MEIFLIFISAIFVNNVVLSQFLGVCPFLGVSKKVGTAVGMTAAVTFVMAIATLVTYLLQYYAVRIHTGHRYRKHGKLDRAYRLDLSGLLRCEDDSDLGLRRNKMTGSRNISYLPHPIRRCLLLYAVLLAGDDNYIRHSYPYRTCW